MSKLLKNTLLYSTGSILPQVAGFLLLPLYTKFLSPQEYGIVNSMQVIQVFLAIFLTFTLERSVLRLYYDYKTEKEKRIFISTIFKGIVICSISTLILVFIFSDTIQLVFVDIKFYPYYSIAILTTFFLSFNIMPKSYYRLKQYANKYISLSIAEFIFSTALTVWFVVGLKEGALGMLKGRMYAFLILVPVDIYILRDFLFESVNFKMLWTSFKFSLPIIPTLLAAWILGQADRIFISSYFSLSEVGLYSMSQKISSIVTVFSSSFMLSYHPLFFELANSDDQVSAKSKLDKYNHTFILILLGLSFLIIFFSREVVVIFLDNRYHDVYLYVPLISFAYLLSSVSSILVGAFYQQSKKMNADMVFGIIGAGFTIILLYLFVKPYGISGAIWASLLSSLFILLLGYLYARKVCYFIPFRWKSLSEVIFTSSILIVLFNYILNLDILVSVGLKLVVILFVSLYFLKKHDKELAVFFPFIKKINKFL